MKLVTLAVGGAVHVVKMSGEGRCQRILTLDPENAFEVALSLIAAGKQAFNQDAKEASQEDVIAVILDDMAQRRDR